MKLADVYFVENNTMGTWAQIGYNAPNGSKGSGSSTTNFTYDQNAATASGSATWGAYNNVALNDCGKNTADVWTITPTFDTTKGEVSYAAAVSVNSCKDLTPNFTKIGH